LQKELSGAGLSLGRTSLAMSFHGAEVLENGYHPSGGGFWPSGR